MKRQGIEGFTFDSKAEEWAAWAWSCVEHHPMTYTDQYRMKRTAADYLADASRLSAQRAAEYAQKSRHSPAQPQNAPEIGVGSGVVSGTSVNASGAALEEWEARANERYARAMRPAPVWPFVVIALLAFIAVFSLGKSVGWL